MFPLGDGIVWPYFSSDIRNFSLSRMLCHKLVSKSVLIYIPYLCCFLQRDKRWNKDHSRPFNVWSSCQRVYTKAVAPMILFFFFFQEKKRKEKRPKEGEMGIAERSLLRRVVTIP